MKMPGMKYISEFNGSVCILVFLFLMFGLQACGAAEQEDAAEELSPLARDFAERFASQLNEHGWIGDHEIVRTRDGFLIRQTGEKFTNIVTFKEAQDTWKIISAQALMNVNHEVKVVLFVDGYERLSSHRDHAEDIAYEYDLPFNILDILHSMTGSRDWYSESGQSIM